MAIEAVRRKLEIVQTSRNIRVRPEDFLEIEHQSSLFPLPRRGLLIFAYFPEITGEEFKKTIESAKPGYIFELRASPRFDFDNLNRKIAFQHFANQASIYVDLTTSWLCSEEPELLLTEFRSYFKNVPVSTDRPLMVLMNRRTGLENLTDTLRKLVSSFLPSITEFLEVPHQ